MVKTDVKLSRQEGKGWKKSIGKHQGRNGKPQYKMWYLGTDKPKAQTLAQFISLEWNQVKRSGAEVWDLETLQRISDYREGLMSPPRQENGSRGESSNVAILSYHQAIDYYCSHVVPKQSCTRQWKRDLIQRVQSLKDALGDVTLKSIGHEELVGIVNYYKKRPPNKNRNNRPISIQYATTLVATAKRLFEWLEDEPGWEMPKRFAKIFSVSKKDFRFTNSDRLSVAEGKQTFQVEELVRLYSNANPDVRDYMILALNCGFTQSEIDSLLAGEVHLDGSLSYIKRIRGKTRDQMAIGKWILWDETVELLRRRVFPKYQFEYKIDEDGTILFKHIHAEAWRKHESSGQEMYDSLVEHKRKSESKILTEEDYVFGGGLIWFNADGQKMDNIACAWWRLLRKTPSVSQYSFKYLRKTGANLIKTLSESEEVAQTYLSHKPTSVSGRHYTNRDYDRLADALSKMRIKLEPMFSQSK